MIDDGIDTSSHSGVSIPSFFPFFRSLCLIRLQRFGRLFGGCTFQDEGKQDKSVNFVQTVGSTFVLSLFSLFICWGVVGGLVGFSLKGRGLCNDDLYSIKVENVP